MFLTLGPLADRATAWEGTRLAAPTPAPAPVDEFAAAPARAPGAVREASFCDAYYDETRAKTQPWIYAGISVIAPLAVLFGSLSLAAMFIAEGPPTPTGIQCAAGGSAQPSLALLDIGGRIHFAAVQVVFVVFCAAVLVISIVAARRIAAVHAWGPGAAVARMAPLLRGRGDEERARIVGPARTRAEEDAKANMAIVWGLGAITLAVVLGFAFHGLAAGVLRPFLRELDGAPCNAAAAAFEKSLATQILLGVFFAIGAMSALAAAVATIAWRFETKDINGRWSDSYILREKLNLLLTLFFLGSALLVLGNLALNATLDWSMTAAGAFTIADKTASVEAFRSFAKAITGFSGVTSSALLIALFVPAFMVLIDDIGIAGQTHASADMGGGSDQYAIDVGGESLGAPFHFVGAVTKGESGGPSPPYRVAGWKKVKDWKEKHGLSMSVTDLSASFLAVAAPILSSGLIEMSKTLVTGQ